jgi:hypothetical protein
MEKSVRVLAIALLSTVPLLLLAGPAEAQIRPGIGRRPLQPLVFGPRPLQSSVFPPNRLPGWDWQRTYPWSPYNYGRNRYNPAVFPYPYLVPSWNPSYNPYPAYYGSSNPAISFPPYGMSK